MESWAGFFCNDSFGRGCRLAIREGTRREYRLRLFLLFNFCLSKAGKGLKLMGLGCTT